MITVKSNTQEQAITVSAKKGTASFLKAAKKASGSLEVGGHKNITAIDVTPVFQSVVDDLGQPGYDFESEIDTLITF